MEPLRHKNTNDSFLENKTDIQNELITRYLSGEASHEEMKQMISWLSKSDENKRMFLSVKHAWIAGNVVYSKNKPSAEQAWNRIQARTYSTFEDNIPTKKPVLLPSFYKVAASVSILIALTSLFYIFTPYFKGATESLTYNEIVVPYGAKSIMTLPDGTKMWINSGTKIRYANNFGKKSREVFMEGEAYFDVVKDSKKPFLVKTGFINIKVLGTAFNVKSYPDENAIETTLDRGLIEVYKDKNADKIITLKPNEKITFQKHPIASNRPNLNTEKKEETRLQTPEKLEAKDSKTGFQVDQNINTSLITSWKDGRLIFERERLEDIIKKLERRYDVIFSFNDSELKNYRFSGSLPELTLQQVLEGMQLSAPIHYKIDKKQVVLSINSNYKDSYNQWIK